MEQPHVDDGDVRGRYDPRVIVRRITYPEALVYRSTHMYLELEIWKV